MLSLVTIKIQWFLIISHLLCIPGTNLCDDIFLRDKPCMNLERGDSLNIYGKWKAAKYKPGKISALTDQQAKAILGKELFLNKSLCIVLNDSCKSPAYIPQKISPETYFMNEYKVEKNYLYKWETDVTVISISCKTSPVYSESNSPNFYYQVIVIDRKNIIIPQNGIFFYFVKQ